MLEADKQLGEDIANGVVRIHRKLGSAELKQIEREFRELEESLIGFASANPELHHRIPLIKRRIVEALMIAVHIKNGPYEFGIKLFQEATELGFDDMLTRVARYLEHAVFCRKKGHKQEAIETLLQLKAYLNQRTAREAEQYLATVENELTKLP